MALPRSYRQHDGLFKTFIKIMSVLALFAVIASAAAVLYFNGDNVKDPLLKLLAERSGLTVDAEKIEFSALYPDTLKMYGVKFGNSSIDEVYIEYDLKSLLSKDLLHIKDLYFKGANPDQKDILACSQRNFGFSSISIDKFTLLDATIKDAVLSAERLNLKASALLLDKEQGIKFNDGKILIHEGKFEGLELKSLSADLENNSDFILVKKLKAKLLGGNVSGELAIDKRDHDLNFSNLQLSGIIIRDFNEFKRSVRIRADQAELSRVAVDLKEQGVYLGEMSGKFSGLILNKETLQGNFEGVFGEISSPKWELSASSSQGRIEFSNERLSAELSGKIFEGDYSVKLTLPSLDDPAININELSLENGLAEPDDLQFNLLKRAISDSKLKIDELKFKNFGLLSHIASLPLSVKSLNGTITKINAKTYSNPFLTYDGFAQISIDELMYSDLFMRKISFTIGASEDLISLNVPVLQFVNSKLNLSAAYDRKLQSGYLLGKTFDFELSELNCDLNPKLLAGTISVDADLKSSGNPFDLSKAEEGSLRIKGDKVMISSFGIDLINGGSMRAFNLNFSELLTALNDADCGMDSAELNVKFKAGLAQVKFNSSLTTAYLSGNGTLDFKNDASSIKATLISHPKDSITTVDISGSPLSPIFSIKPLSRGENRPGLMPNINR